MINKVFRSVLIGSVIFSVSDGFGMNAGEKTKEERRLEYLGGKVQEHLNCLWQLLDKESSILSREEAEKQLGAALGDNLDEKVVQEILEKCLGMSVSKEMVKELMGK